MRLESCIVTQCQWYTVCREYSSHIHTNSIVWQYTRKCTKVHPSPPEATGGIPEAGSKEAEHDDH